MRTLPADECSAQLALLRGELRGEFRVRQVVPKANTWLQAYVPIRDGHAAAVTAFLAAGSDWLRNMLRVRDSDALRAAEPEFFDALPGKRQLLGIGHSTDRTYIGQGDIIDALRGLCRHLEDARFFMQEGEGSWIDELRIERGELHIVRRVEESDERYDSDADLLLAIAWERPDADLEALVGRLYLDDAQDAIQKLLYESRPDARSDAEAEARARIGDAASLAGCGALALAMRSWLELCRDDTEAAAATAHAALAQGETTLARFVALAVALAQGRDAEVAQHVAALAQRAPFHTEALVAGLASVEKDRCGALLRARLDTMPSPFRERGWVYTFDTPRVRMLAGGAFGARLDHALLSFGQRVAADDARAAAMLLFGWGEQLRIIGMQPGIVRTALHTRARRMMDAALTLSPLGPEAAQRRGFLGA